MFKVFLRMLFILSYIRECLHVNGYVTVNHLRFCLFLYALQPAGRTSTSFMGSFLKDYLVQAHDVF